MPAYEYAKCVPHANMYETRVHAFTNIYAHIQLPEQFFVVLLKHIKWLWHTHPSRKSVLRVS